MSTHWEFDETYYLTYNLDVAQAGIDAYSHWLNYGIYEGRSAGHFTNAIYLSSHSDVAAAVARGDYANGWEHFIAFGSAENRLPFGEYYAQGTSTDDILSLSYISSRENVRMYGYDGADSLTGGAGDDVLYGNKGLDAIAGGDGSDTIYGGQNDGPADADGVLRSGVETLDGGNGGSDLIYGNHGTDYIIFRNNDNTVYGGQDDDTIVAMGDSFYRAVLYGNRGDDQFVFEDIYSGVYDTTVIGGAGADTITAAAVRFSYQIDFADFNPDEGDRVDIGFTPVAINQSGTQVTFETQEFYTRYNDSVTIDFNRSDFSNDWWF